jgi:hypothetical protein
LRCFRVRSAYRGLLSVDLVRPLSRNSASSRDGERDKGGRLAACSRSSEDRILRNIFVISSELPKFFLEQPLDLLPRLAALVVRRLVSKLPRSGHWLLFDRHRWPR